MYVPEGCVVVYKKKDNSIVHRDLQYRPYYKIGDVNSYGWKVQEILCRYNGTLYPEAKYRQLRDKAHHRYELKEKYRTLIETFNIYRIVRIILEEIIILYIVVKLLQKY